MVWKESANVATFPFSLVFCCEPGLLYLHQLCKEVHGYGGASVEEHGCSSQEAWERRGGTEGHVSHTAEILAKFLLDSWNNRTSPAINAWSSSSMFRIQRNKQLVTWTKENHVKTRNQSDAMLTGNTSNYGDPTEVELNLVYADEWS